MSRRGLLVGVGDLLRRPGTRREVTRTMASPGYEVAGSTVPEGRDVELDLVVESTADPGTLTVDGHVAVAWEGQCRRCLDPVEGELSIEVHEVFSAAPDLAGPTEDVWPLEGEEIDLAEVVSDAVLLALPLAPLCGAECRGPAPEEFPARPEDGASGDDTGDVAEEGGGAEEPPRDPRWEALDDLRFD